MAIIGTPEASRGIMGAIKGALGLFNDTNKAEGVQEDSNTQPRDEYESTLENSKIIELTREWKRDFGVYYTPIQESQELAFNYWIGKQRVGDNGQVQASDKNPNEAVDNLQFEAIETFLPIATRANPDPLVSADPSEIGQRIAKSVKTSLVNWADEIKLRRKLARMTRHWIIYLLGALKVSWDPKTKSIKLDNVNPKWMIFDKDGYIDEGGHFIGEYVGEKKRATADTLTELFPNKKAFITQKAHGKMGTKLDYYEWWYKGADIFYTLDEEVLGKFKNPNWNYDISEVPSTPAVPGNPGTGELDQPEIPGQPGAPGANHLKEPQAPYIFLSVFSMGLHPYDETSLVLQNLSIQDLINRRWRQIDKNVEGMNNGIVVSGTAFTEAQAAQAAAALRRGVAIRIPNGDVNSAVKFPDRKGLPTDVFNNLQDARNELRGIFGTSGSTPQAVQKEDTVRGKILVNQQDSSRIGGGITEQIEQVADSVYNWVVQMMYVYYDEEHFVTSAGATGGTELVTLVNTDFPLLKSLSVTVKEGSLVPKDPLTKRNEAIDLWSAQAIDPLNFYKALDFPDPAQATQQLLLWQMLQKGQIMPQQYLPSFEVPQIQAPQQTLPSGVGDQSVNNLDASAPAAETPVPQSPPAVEAESKQLLGSVPLQ